MEWGRRSFLEAGGSALSIPPAVAPPASNLSRVLELPHCRVVPNFAGCSLRGADEVSQGLGDILYCIDEHHLCGDGTLLCEGEGQQEVRLWTELGRQGRDT